MKKSNEETKDGKKRMEVFKRIIEPIGEVRKYFVLLKVTSVMLIALLVYFATSLMAIRTGNSKQPFMAGIILASGLSVVAMVGLYSKTLFGYVSCVVSSLTILLLLQVGNGGRSFELISNHAEYGEAIVLGAQSVGFWILLAKIVAAAQVIFPLLFIWTEKKPIKPEEKGMNLFFLKIRSWFKRTNSIFPPGHRPSDYWVAGGCLVLWMLVAQNNPYDTGRYDYEAMGLVILGVIMVLLGKTLIGAYFLLYSALISCTMYQYRFGVSVPTVAAYCGVWVALFFLFLEVRGARKTKQKNSWAINFGSKVSIMIPIAKEEYCATKGSRVLNRVAVWGAVMIVILMFSVHEFLSAFSGSFMIYQKDNLPLYFFLPIVMVICANSGSVLGYIESGIAAYWLIDALRNASPYNGGLFRFDSIEQHGEIGALVTQRMNIYVEFIVFLAFIYMVICILAAVTMARRIYGKAEAVVVD